MQNQVHYPVLAEPVAPSEPTTVDRWLGTTPQRPPALRTTVGALAAPVLVPLPAASQADWGLTALRSPPRPWAAELLGATVCQPVYVPPVVVVDVPVDRWNGTTPQLQPTLRTALSATTAPVLAPLPATDWGLVASEPFVRPQRAALAGSAAGQPLFVPSPTDWLSPGTTSPTPAQVLAGQAAVEAFVSVVVAGPAGVLFRRTPTTFRVGSRGIPG